MKIEDRISKFINEVANQNFGYSDNMKKYPLLRDWVNTIFNAVYQAELVPDNSYAPQIVDYKDSSIIMVFKVVSNDLESQGGPKVNSVRRMTQVLNKFYSNHRCTLDPQRSYMSQPTGVIDSAAMDKIKSDIGYKIKGWGNGLGEGGVLGWMPVIIGIDPNKI